MKYLKSGIAVLLAAGLAVTAANAQNVHKVSSPKRVTQWDAVINSNATTAEVPSSDWNHRITFSGLLNLDATYASRGWNIGGKSTTVSVLPGFTSGTPHASDIAVRNANLLIDARVNSFTNAHLGLIYADIPGAMAPGADTFFAGVDEAYITLSDFARSPFYMRAGREYTPFGTYATPYALTPSMTDLLSITLANVAELGYVSHSGLHAVVYASSGVYSSPVSKSTNANEEHVASSQIKNFGVKLAYNDHYGKMAYRVSGAYVQDIRDVAYLVGQNAGASGFPVNSAASPLESRRAAGFSAHADMAEGAFDFQLDYVAAARALVATKDTRIAVYGLQAGYRFNGLGAYPTKVTVGYQRANNVGDGTFFTGLPKYRMQFDYNINLSHHTDITLQYVNNRAFTNDSANALNLRLGVRF